MIHFMGLFYVCYSFAMKSEVKFIVGIDEAGRGPLAGPVSVGVFAVKAKNLPTLKKLFKGVKESKQLTAESREGWFARIQQAKTEGLCDFQVILKTASQIDSKGIAVCIRESIAEALDDLDLDKHFKETKILLDGGLKAPAQFSNQKTIIKGDEKEMLIALASIAAKVTRDRKMVAFAKAYPGYGFEIHKGYGTAGHGKAIRKLGLSELHRRSFTRRFHDPSWRPTAQGVAKKRQIG